MCWTKVELQPGDALRRIQGQERGDPVEAADETFSPVFLRNATAYGASPKLRADLMVNSLVGYAFLSGEVLIKSDGSPWRPLVHIEDISRAFLAALEAPREWSTTGRSTSAARRRTIRSGRSRSTWLGWCRRAASSKQGGGPDKRCYRVDFSRAENELPGFAPTWTVPAGIEELLACYRANGLTMADFEGGRFVRLRR